MAPSGALVLAEHDPFKHRLCLVLRVSRQTMAKPFSLCLAALGAALGKRAVQALEAHEHWDW